MGLTELGFKSFLRKLIESNRKKRVLELRLKGFLLKLIESNRKKKKGGC